VTNTEMLNAVIKKSGLKKSFLAERIGLTRVGFSNCLSGKSEFKASQIAVLCELLDIRSLELKEAIFFAE